MTATMTKRPSKKDLAESAKKAATKLGLAKPIPAARSEKTPEKTAKAKKTAEKSEKKTTKPEKTGAGRDGWGRKMDTGSHAVNRAIIEAGENGITMKELTERAKQIAAKIGAEPRGAVGSMVNSLRLVGWVEYTGGKWRATAEGLKLWKAGYSGKSAGSILREQRKKAK